MSDILLEGEEKKQAGIRERFCQLREVAKKKMEDNFTILSLSVVIVQEIWQEDI